MTTDYPIPASAIEAAARASVEGGKNERRGDWVGMSPGERQPWIEGQEAALRAAFDELGIQCERGAARSIRWVSPWFAESRWMPVEKPYPEERPEQRTPDELEFEGIKEP